MGSIADFYESGGQSANEGVFSHLVRISQVDGTVDENELIMLKRIAQRLSLTEIQAKMIMKNPDEYPMIPPVSRESRLEQLIQLVQMTFADGTVDSSEMRLLIRFGVGLGFDQSNIESTIETILTKIKAGESRDAILQSLS